MKSISLGFFLLLACHLACHGGNQQSAAPAASQTVWADSEYQMVEVDLTEQTVLYESARQEAVVPLTKESAPRYLKTLIRQEKVDQQTKDGATPLMVAAEFGLSSLACQLYANGASIDTTLLGSGETALSIASAKGDVKIVSCLIHHATHRIRGFVEAARNGHIPVLQVFLPSPPSPPLVDINKSSGNDTALTAASRAGKRASVVFLLNHGASVNATTGNGHTPLACSLLTQCRATAQVLVDRGGTIPDISWDKREDGLLMVQSKRVGYPVQYECKQQNLVACLIQDYEKIHGEKDCVMVVKA